MPTLTRRPTLYDAAILVAAVAASLGVYRWLYPPAEGWPIWTMKVDSHEGRVGYATGLIYLAWPLLLCATMAFAAVRLIGPRPRFGRLLRQPGSVAGFTALAYFGVGVIVSRVLAEAAHLRPPALARMFTEDEQGRTIMSICRAGTGAGYAIASAWILMGLAGRWRRGAGWIEAMGLGLGLAWIVFSVSYSIRPHL